MSETDTVSAETKVPRRTPLARLTAGKSGPPRVLMVLAALVVVMILTPVIFLIVEAFTQPTSATLNALFRQRTLDLTVNTVLLVVSVTLGALVIGIPTAFLIARTNLVARKFWHIAAALPLAIPSYVAGFAWVSLTPIRGFWGSFLALVLVSAPYVTLPVIAALRRSDIVIEGVARTLGVGPWRAFFMTMLPQIAPAAGAGALLVALYTLSDFGVVAIMRYPAFTWAIQTAFSGTFNRALAIVLSLVLVILAMLVVMGERAVRRRTTHYDRIRTASVTDLKKLRPRTQLLAVLGLGGVFAISVGFPVVTLVQRSIQSVAERDIDYARLIDAGVTTVGLGFAGAIVATLLALPIGILSARYNTKRVAALETTTFFGHGLPGIVLGLSMVYMTLLFVPALYQTLALLVIAYGILFAPKATGSVRSAVAQVPVQLESVSRSLGRSKFGTWFAVTARIAWPGIAAGAMLVALTVMKELPATLMMRPTGVDTLATRLWQLTDIAAYGAAAPYGILLIVVASVPALMLARESRKKQ